MRIFSFYKDFFLFLEKILPGTDKWREYRKFYLTPHQEFLNTYFSHFPILSQSSLRQRVEKAKASDYSWLRHLISTCPPEKIILEAYERCRRIVSSKRQPNVYLFIGFFSPDAFVMDFQGKPVICFGLERFRDFRLLRILFAHEYAHFLLNQSQGEIPEDKKLEWLLISEGIGVHFSLLAFPEYKLTDHLLMRRDTFNWCQSHEEILKSIYFSGDYSTDELMDIFRMGHHKLKIPPRTGNFLGFQAVKKYLSPNSERKIGLLLSNKQIALSLELSSK